MCALGVGRPRVKIGAAGTLSPDTTTYLAAMQSKYKIADIQKAVRIVLDYALEDGGESLIDALVA